MYIIYNARLRGSKILTRNQVGALLLKTCFSRAHPKTPGVKQVENVSNEKENAVSSSIPFHV